MSEQFVWLVQTFLNGSCWYRTLVFVSGRQRAEMIMGGLSYSMR
jgi:hypothetical protein